MRKNTFIGHQFDNNQIELEILRDFWRKDRLVAYEYMVKPLAVIINKSVVLHKTVCIALIIMIPNNLDVKTADILNTYVMAPVKEKVWTTM